MTERLTFDAPGHWKAYAEFVDFNRVFRMAIFRESDRDQWPALVAAPIEMKAFDGPLIGEPTVEMHAPEGRRMLQAIVDAAWEAGIKPAGMDDHIRETAAMRRHLEDMRALTFAKSGATKP